MSGKYDDIISLPHHVSPKRPRMSAMERAAQFSPFSALTGLGAQMDETARLTDVRLELDDYAKLSVNEVLRELAEHSGDHPTVRVTYFIPDERKDGGSYETLTAKVKKVDAFYGLLVLENEIKIPIEEIYELDKVDD